MFSGEITDISCEIYKKPVTRKVMSVYRNTEARWLNRNCRGKVIHITYSGCVSIALIV